MLKSQPHNKLNTSKNVPQYLAVRVRSGETNVILYYSVVMWKIEGVRADGRTTVCVRIVNIFTISVGFAEGTMAKSNLCPDCVGIVGLIDITWMTDGSAYNRGQIA